MENTYTQNHEMVLDEKTVALKEKVTLIGIFVFIMASLGLFTFYGVSMGYYPVPVAMFLQ